ncbi:MAG: tetratricopeptide repeat protein [Chloroflexi bacterium]|nr:tetratricopeptide repeat protein [Chloroflexota bacterium]
MAGNKAIYDTAMKRAHEYAWANQWDRAQKEYGRALTEFPEDRTAQRNMAQCLFRLRQWPEALAAYQELINTDPGDLFAINRLAEVYLAVGQPDNALSTYTRLANLYIAGNQLHEAIRALRDLSRALPRNRDTHNRLLELAQEVGDRQAQVAEHLALSEIALGEGKWTEAQGHADAAASFDPENPDVRRWSVAVRRKLAESVGTNVLSGDVSEMGIRPAGAPGTHMLPQADLEPPEAAALVEQATAAQDNGYFKQAMELYDQAVRAGARRPAVFYNAGLLNQQMGRPDLAIPFLERALQDPEFAMSSNYVIGKCHHSLRNYSKAANVLERALALVDPGKLARTDVDELLELYTAAADANLADNNPGRAASLYSNLVNLLKERRWAIPQLPELEKKATELYNTSIQSKLLGISRGGSMLDAGFDGGAIEATRVIVDGQPGAEGATTQLPMGTGAIVGEASNQPPSFGEAPTTMMRGTGGNLRTITEYLRAADIPGHQEPDEETSENATLISRIATEAPSALEANAGQHTFTALPSSTLVNIEQQSLRVQRLLAEGEQAMSEGQWNSAVDICMAVIVLESGYLPIHMLLGDIYLHQGKTEEAFTKYQTVMDSYMARQEAENAAEVCRRMLQLQPDNPSLQQRLGVLLMAAGKADEAAKALLSIVDKLHLQGDTERALQEAQALNAQIPDSSEIALALGTYQMALGSVRPALAELGRALQLNPGNDIALARLYILLAMTNDPTQWDALQSVLERASKDKSENRLFMEELYSAMKRKPVPSVYYGIATLAERSEMPDVAADALDQGLQAMSLSATSELDPSWLLLEILMCQSRADLALQAKEGAVSAQYYARALDLLKTHGALDDAGNAFQTALLQSPRPQYSFVRLSDPTQLYYGLAEAHASQNHWEGALSALQALKLLMPTDHSVHTRLADIYFRQGQLQQALAELNDLLVLYQKANDHEKTLETLGHMSRLAPNNVPVHRKLSDMYLKLGMTEYGLTELSTLAELQLKAGLLKDAMRTYQKAGDIHYTLGQHDQAISIYERIVRIAPRDTEARHQLINMYVQSGKVGDAVAAERSLAEMSAQEGRTEEAIGALHQLLALAPEDVPAHHMLAKQLTAMGEYGQAARLYGRLLRLDPDNDRVPTLQSEMLRMAKEAKQEEGKKSVQEKPSKKKEPAPSRR